MTRTKTYFLSDLHLGAPYIDDAKIHEARIVSFLDKIKTDAKAVYLLGDIFDFWYEYKQVIPRGFVRFQAKIAELCDEGIKVHFFTGNHDTWMFDYFQEELGVILHKEPTEIEIDGKNFFLAHGEDLGIEDWAFKKMLQLFKARWFQWLFSTFIHPNLAMRLAQAWSTKSRKKNEQKDAIHYLGENKEYQVVFAKNYKSKDHVDYFIFGHRHLVLDLMIKKDSRVIILGDWINFFSYAEVADGKLIMNQLEQ